MKEKFDEFKKFDSKKPAFDLLPPKALREVAQVLTFGAKKYERHNWKKCRDLDRLIRATLGHIFDWQEDQNSVDSESGIDSLAHAACNLLFLQELKYIIKDETVLFENIMGKNYIHPDDKEEVELFSAEEKDNYEKNKKERILNEDFGNIPDCKDKSCTSAHQSKEACGGISHEYSDERDNTKKTVGLQNKYFNLKPKGNDAYAIASRVAMISYADAIRQINPDLAKDLERWVDKERKVTTYLVNT